MRTPAVLGAISIALFIVYAVLINYVFTPIVTKPWGYCIFGACVSLTTSTVAWMGTFPVYVNVPLIGTDLIMARLHEDKVNPRVAGENYGFMARAYLLINAIVFLGPYFEGLMWARVSPIDYLLAIMAVCTGEVYYVAMKRYFLGRVRLINY
jgi:hypothetical protein